MWSYYGSKSRICKKYPKPLYDTIIEPFAGTARYSLRYFEKDIILYDAYSHIIDIWKYLQSASVSDILGLPILKTGEDLRNFNLSNEEVKFMRFQISIGLSQPIWKCSPMCNEERQNASLVKVSNNLFKIKHWKFFNLSYEKIKNTSATWFIDPPYQYGGHKYQISNRSLDYKSLSKWCMERKGQSIVCENDKANWMDFKTICKNKGTKNVSKECMWTNLKTSMYNNQINMGF